MPFRYLLLIISLFCVQLSAKAAEKSLYDKGAAQKIDVSKLSILGPKAGRFRYDKRLVHAAEIAAERARAHSRGVCWRYVKDALLSAGLVDTRPDTVYAKQAANELTSEYPASGRSSAPIPTRPPWEACWSMAAKAPAISSFAPSRAL